MKKTILALIVAMSIFSCQKIDRELPSGASKAKTEKFNFFNENVKKLAPFEKNVLLVGLTDNITKSRVFSKNPVIKFHHTAAMKRKGDNGFTKVSSLDLFADSVRLSQDPNVKWISRNWSVQTQTVNDPYYNVQNLWGSFAINQQAAWNAGNYGSQSVIVQVIDEPPFNAHEDLCGQFLINEHEPIDGKDNDLNGYIDDRWGWNFFLGTNVTYQGPNLKHGTHVSGTVGAKFNNGVGITGVSANVTLLATPFLGPGGGYIDRAVEATDYGTDLKQRHGYNVSHSTNSWGGGGSSQSMVDAIHRAEAADIGFIAAAGNSDNNNDVNPAPSYPAAYSPFCPNIIAVGASAWDNNKAGFSSYGQISVHLFAPGTGILSTVPLGYQEMSGTSMATPHVAGAAALLRAAHPTWTFLQIKAALIASVTPVASLIPYC